MSRRFMHSALAILVGCAVAGSIGCGCTHKASTPGQAPPAADERAATGDAALPAALAGAHLRSIERYPSGALEKGTLREETLIGGRRCRGWVWCYTSGALRSFELAAPAEIQGHAFPEATRAWLREDGTLDHVWLNHPATIAGYPCRGWLKTAVSFHPSGALKGFFLEEDHDIQGVPCRASHFEPVYVHPDGKLASCALARDWTHAGITHGAGSRVTFDETGKLIADPDPNAGK